MGNESGEWIMHGLSPHDPNCIKTVKKMCEYIEKVGFLPLFANEIPGFSVEEHTETVFWWSGDVKRDPWEWREQIAREGKIAYGKFFGKKAGFISLKWLPLFVNYRRDGYDFDALWDDEKASYRQKRIMDCFDDDTEILSNQLKEKAGFGSGGEKNFDGIVTDLQMECYLVVRDFRQRLNKKGEPYGWPVALYCKPEHLWGYDEIAAAYKEEPSASREKIRLQMTQIYGTIDDKRLKSLGL